MKNKSKKHQSENPRKCKKRNKEKTKNMINTGEIMVKEMKINNTKDKSHKL